MMYVYAIKTHIIEDKEKNVDYIVVVHQLPTIIISKHSWDVIFQFLSISLIFCLYVGNFVFKKLGCEVLILIVQDIVKFECRWNYYTKGLMQSYIVCLDKLHLFQGHLGSGWVKFSFSTWSRATVATTANSFSCMVPYRRSWTLSELVFSVCQLLNIGVVVHSSMLVLALKEFLKKVLAGFLQWLYQRFLSPIILWSAIFKGQF